MIRPARGPLHTLHSSLMTTLYRNPRIATLVHRQTPYRGQWVIYQDSEHHYQACHEVEQFHGKRKIVESLMLDSLAEAQTFSTYLSSYGWTCVWQT